MEHHQTVDHHMVLERQQDKVSSVEHLGMALDTLAVADCSLDKALHLLLLVEEACRKEHLTALDTAVDLRLAVVGMVPHQEELMVHKVLNLVLAGHIDLLHLERSMTHKRLNAVTCTRSDVCIWIRTWTIIFSIRSRLIA